jgi:hypothetical protein
MNGQSGHAGVLNQLILAYLDYDSEFAALTRLARLGRSG